MDERKQEDEGKVELTLSHDEALVFFDWLARFNSAEEKYLADQAEERVLWDLEAMLESVLVELLDPNYKQLVEKARAAVRDPAL